MHVNRHSASVMNTTEIISWVIGDPREVIYEIIRETLFASTSE
jgi:hypothetical protein